MNILITLTPEQQVEIEEYCVNLGISFTQYFISLHQQFQKKINPKKEIEAFSEEEAQNLFKKKTEEDKPFVLESSHFDSDHSETKRKKYSK